MRSAIYMDGNRFTEVEFKNEEEFEKVVKDNSKIFFGVKTIYFDLKNKVESKTLGSAIPDGLLFDLRDKDNPEFYLVEVELQKHDFYKHMFPQITKFFAFFKNTESRNNLVDRVFSIIKSNPMLEREFTALFGRKEVYKTLKDMIENSQNILLILDESKAELQEVFETYTDTWDKMVKVEILKEYTANERMIFSINPDFEDIGLIEPATEEGSEERYSESYHLDDAESAIASVYLEIKSAMKRLDQGIRMNPQKYYISLRKNKNFAYLYLKRRKIHIILMLPIDIGRNMIKKHKLTTLSEAVQKFYGGPCFSVTLQNEDNLTEVIRALEEAYKRWQ